MKTLMMERADDALHRADVPVAHTTCVPPTPLD